MISKLINALTLGRLKWGWYSLSSPTPDSPIVIGGCSRSGTTLFYSILNSHSRLFLGLETALFAGNMDLPAHLPTHRYVLGESETALPEKSLLRCVHQANTD